MVQAIYTLNAWSQKLPTSLFLKTNTLFKKQSTCPNTTLFRDNDDKHNNILTTDNRPGERSGDKGHPKSCRNMLAVHLRRRQWLIKLTTKTTHLLRQLHATSNRQTYLCTHPFVCSVRDMWLKRRFSILKPFIHHSQAFKVKTKQKVISVCAWNLSGFYLSIKKYSTRYKLKKKREGWITGQGTKQYQAQLESTTVQLKLKINDEDFLFIPNTVLILPSCLFHEVLFTQWLDVIGRPLRPYNDCVQQSLKTYTHTRYKMVGRAMTWAR